MKKKRNLILSHIKNILIKKLKLFILIKIPRKNKYYYISIIYQKKNAL